MKCVLFARVSTQGQDYEHQLRQLRPVAIANGYADSDIITVEGKESAISLEEEQRETLQEMKELIKQVIKQVIVHKNKQWDYDITVELTDAAQGLSDSVIGLKWHYESKAGKKLLWCGNTEISCKGAIAMLRQQRDNAPLPPLPQPPEWAS